MGNGKICFVIMGYGVKTDYSTGRQLDLDKTYKKIIKPAVESLGITCIRADELRHSGVIDWPMYQYLIKADIVIADLSTYNPNAFYELGVRHALKPYTTIAIAENKLKEPFDINHTIIRKYEHLGKGIDYDEVLRFQEELKSVIQRILTNPKTDSPVYTYLKGLKQPEFKEIKTDLSNENNEKETLSVIIERAKEFLDTDDFIQAKALFEMGLKIDSNNTYLLQKLVLSTYKSEYPNRITALNNALDLLENLAPETTTDPETLGLAGAIYKRLWEEVEDRNYLNKAIYYCEKGYYIKNDYYNGINLAFLLNIRGSLNIGDDAIADHVLAKRVRKQVIKICNKIVEDSNLINRNDQYWVWATLEEAYFSLSDELDYLNKYNLAREKAVKLAKNNWERKTTESQIEKLKGLLGKYNSREVGE